MHIFIPGGAGYVGSKLVPKLLSLGHEVTVYDLFLYGDDIFSSIEHHPKLHLVKADIREKVALDLAMHGCDAVIHLACISNDPSFELNPKLGKSINYDSFEPLVVLAKKNGIRRFIFASSSSVYGIKKEANVTEDMSLEPLTDYSKYKAMCEDILMKYADDTFICTVIRPATVCGFAPRQRLDVIVNILTNHAYNKGAIQVTGGAQLRPNIHIDDMVDAYICVLEAEEEKVQKKIYNAGYYNHSVDALADIVHSKVSPRRDVLINKIPTSDPRSYHISSEKIEKELGFKPKKTIEDAVEDLVDAFEQGKIPNSLEDKKYYNIQTMKALQIT
jgi:nucleoside-diphosphate-sugar epimerase